MNASDKLNKVLLGLLACAALLGEGAAHAELVLYDKEGWTVKHDGRAQGFYQLGFGQTNPEGGTGAIYHDFDFLDTSPGDADNKFLSSRFRSGWTSHDGRGLLLQHRPRGIRNRRGLLRIVPASGRLPANAALRRSSVPAGSAFRPAFARSPRRAESPNFA